jgi:hypothetical protein
MEMLKDESPLTKSINVKLANVPGTDRKREIGSSILRLVLFSLGQTAHLIYIQ